MTELESVKAELAALKRMLHTVPTGDDGTAHVIEEIERCRRLAQRAEDSSMIVVSKGCSDSVGRLEAQLLRLREQSAQFIPAGRMAAALGSELVEAMRRADVPEDTVCRVVDDAAERFTAIYSGKAA